MLWKSDQKLCGVQGEGLEMDLLEMSAGLLETLSLLCCIIFFSTKVRYFPISIKRNGSEVAPWMFCDYGELFAGK